MTNPTFRLTIDNPRLARKKLSGALQLWDLTSARIVWGCAVEDFNDEQILGDLISELEAYLGEPSLALNSAVEGAKAAIATDDVNPFEHPKFKAMTDKVINELSEAGRFISTPANAFYLDQSTETPIEIEGVEMAALLWFRRGINQADALAKHLKNALRYHTFLFGEKVPIRQLAHYNRDDNVMTVDCGNGQMLHLDGKTVRKIGVTETDILFSHPLLFQPWTYVEDHGSPLRQLFDSFSFMEGNETPLAPGEQRLLLLLLLTSVFFRSEMKVKPILIATGHTDSGKSSLVRILLRILFGPDADLGSIQRDKEDDFWTNVTNNICSPYDNLDTKVPWLEDALCKAADGVVMPKRVLHTTNELATFKPDTFLMLTSRTPNFRRPDVSNRSLIFELMQRIESNKETIGEEDLYEDLEKMRNRYLSELVDICNQTLAIPRQRANDSPIRSRDFYAVALRIAKGQGIEAKMRRVFKKLRQAQHGFSTEDNPAVLAVTDWVDRTGPGGVQNAGRQVSTKVLFEECKVIAEKAGYGWTYERPNGFGMALAELGEGLDQYFLVLQKDRKGGKGTIWRLAPLDWAGKDSGRLDGI